MRPSRCTVNMSLGNALTMIQCLDSAAYISRYGSDEVGSEASVVLVTLVCAETNE